MKLLTTLAAIAAIGLPFLGEQAGAETIRKYNFNSLNGVSLQYQKKTCSNSDAYVKGSLFKIVNSPSLSSGKALRHKIRDCDERSEVILPRGFFKKNREYWIGWNYFFPKNFNQPGKKDYTVINQIMYDRSWIDQQEGKSLFECNRSVDGGKRTAGAPGSDMTISPDGRQFTFKLKHFKGKDSKGRNIFTCDTFRFSAQTDRWQRFIMRVKYSDNPNDGIVTLYRNGEEIFSRRVALLPPGKEPGVWKMGAYVGDPGNGERTLYTDELKVGTSYQEVLP